MIHVQLSRRQGTGELLAYSVRGHADYAEHGKDIVCAGVSAIAVGTVNAVKEVAGVKLSYQMRDGDLRVEVPAKLPTDTADQVQTILESMVVMLETIQQSYDAYINIKTVKRR